MSTNPVVSFSSMPPPESTGTRRTVSIPLIAGIAALAVVATAVGVAYQRYQAYQTTAAPDKMAAGITIAGVQVGGLSREEARQRVRNWAIVQMNKPVTFIAPQSGRRWNIPVGDIGGRFEIDKALDKAFAIGKNASLWERILQGRQENHIDIAPDFAFSESALDKQIARIAGIVDRSPENAKARIGDNGEILLAVHDKKGISLDENATKAALLQKGPDSLRNGAQVSLVIREERPRVTAADLGKMSTPLGSYTTEYSSSTAERSHNVELAASKINGTVLAPGEEFSYNRVVGERNARNGWQPALMFQEGEVVPSLGGGVCQVASTLYNAVLQTNLKVKERQNHSIKVHYVDPGRDATVAWGALDFRFANTTDGPIIVLARTRHRRLTMNIFGTGPKPTDKVEIITGPYKNNSLGGITVATYRVIHHADGKVTREYLHTDSYRAPVASGESKRKSAPRPRRIVAPNSLQPAASKQSPTPQPSVPPA